MTKLTYFIDEESYKLLEVGGLYRVVCGLCDWVFDEGSNNFKGQFKYYFDSHHEEDDFFKSDELDYGTLFVYLGNEKFFNYDKVCFIYFGIIFKKEA
jgi:hypothetical protein